MRHRCHVVCVDAAGDEMLASELMRLPVSDVFGQLTPNLQCVIRDKAHASRRIVAIVGGHGGGGGGGGVLARGCWCC